MKDSAHEKEFSIPIFEDQDIIRFTSPLDFPIIRSFGEDINVKIFSKQNGMINLFHNGQLVAQNYGDSLSFNFVTQTYGKNFFHYEMQSLGNTYIDSFFYIVEQPQVSADPPQNTLNGIL